MGEQIKKIKDGKVISKLFEEKKDKHEKTNINKVEIKITTIINKDLEDLFS